MLLFTIQFPRHRNILPKLKKYSVAAPIHAKAFYLDAFKPVGTPSAQVG